MASLSNSILLPSLIHSPPIPFHPISVHPQIRILQIFKIQSTKKFKFKFRFHQMVQRNSENFNSISQSIWVEISISPKLLLLIL
uniref:Uncharacterized protein n=1 Tax=Medicago truncatula TaxID=3880 RepID=A2Q326_MEDTR|nr:hypothetical protein MtrDRAFT_AC154391g11v2 [Medicago truncatula]